MELITKVSLHKSQHVHRAGGLSKTSHSELARMIQKTLDENETAFLDTSGALDTI